MSERILERAHQRDGRSLVGAPELVDAPELSVTSTISHGAMVRR
jgi:hypothetical protein